MFALLETVVGRGVVRRAKCAERESDRSQTSNALRRTTYIRRACRYKTQILDLSLCRFSGLVE